MPGFELTQKTDLSMPVIFVKLCVVFNIIYISIIEAEIITFLRKGGHLVFFAFSAVL